MTNSLEGTPHEFQPVDGDDGCEVLWQRVIRRLHVLKLAPVDWRGAPGPRVGDAAEILS